MIMKKYNFMIAAMVIILQTHDCTATLNNFGISDIVPTKSDDNQVFDQRINEEMAHGNLILSGRHTQSFTLQDILDFIPRIEKYFQHLLDTHNKNPEALRLVRLAIIDVQKAKKMLRSNKVTPEEEHKLRLMFDPIKVKINAYQHTDNVEASSYIMPQ